MVQRQEILMKLKTIIEENLNVKIRKEMTEEDRLSEDLYLDSIMVLQLVVYIEEAFGITVPDGDLDPEIFKTVGALITFIEELRVFELNN